MENQYDTVYQYHDQKGFPVFVAIEGYGEDESLVTLSKILDQMKFSELSPKEVEALPTRLDNEVQARLLVLRPATSKVTQQIDSASKSDRFGYESVLPKTGYKVYRFKGMALMVYSYAANTWECGVTEAFGQGEEGIFAARTVINRFLSWALAPHGVIGLWGVPVKEGLVVLKQSESQGEVVFIDMNEKLLLSMDGKKGIPLRFRIMRLDNKLSGRNIRMTSDELLSFLSVHSSFLDPMGLSRPMRQLLQALSRLAEGLIHPRESFQSRDENLREVS